MKRIYSTLATLLFAAGAVFAQDLELRGVIDFTVPEGGASGKAIHVKATADIADLSIYGIGVANNGGGTDGQEYTFPAISAANGDDILVVRDSQAMANFFAGCFGEFEMVLTEGTDDISQNGDDAIEFFHNGSVIDTYGDVDVDGSGEPWEYLDAWAYKEDNGSWTTATPDCTDDATTIYDASCRYPICPDIMVTSITVTAEGGNNFIDVMGGTLQMSATVMPENADDTTFTWSVNDESIGTIDTNGLVTAVANGMLTVIATANDGSGITGELQLDITNQSSGSVRSNWNLANLQVYPNPASDVLTIETPGALEQVRVLSIDGKLVPAQISGNALDVSTLRSGTYLLEVQSEGNTLRTRFNVK